MIWDDTPLGENPEWRALQYAMVRATSGVRHPSAQGLANAAQVNAWIEGLTRWRTQDIARSTVCGNGSPVENNMTLGIEELLSAQLEAMVKTNEGDNDERNDTTERSARNIIGRCRREICKAATSITHAQDLESYVTRGLRRVRRIRKGDIAEYIGWIEVETACELATAPRSTISYLEKGPPWLSQIVLGGLPGNGPTFVVAAKERGTTRSFEETVADWIADLCDRQMSAIGGQPSRAPPQEVAAQALRWRRPYEIPPLSAVCACARFGPKLNSDTRWGAAIRATKATRDRYERQLGDKGRDKTLVDVEEALADRVWVEAKRFSRVTALQMRTAAKNELEEAGVEEDPEETLRWIEEQWGKVSTKPRTLGRTKLHGRRKGESVGIYIDYSNAAVLVLGALARGGTLQNEIKETSGVLISITNEDTSYVNEWLTEPEHVASKEQIRIAGRIDRKIAQSKGHGR